MSKTDYPALRMTVDGGRLIPAGPFDAERLNSYRRGTVVYVRFTEEKDRVLIRKWFAVLGLVLKQCQTPWKNKDEAHEAIKLALGIVNLSKTVGGQFMQYPKSLADLEDPELQEALEQMTELLSRMTGVDVATLKKETAHIVEHEDHDPTTGEIIEHGTTESGRPPEPDADEAPSPASSAGVTESSPSSVTPTLADASTSQARTGDAEAEATDASAPTASVASNPEMSVLIRFAADILPKAADTNVSASALKAIEKRWGASEIADLSEDGKEIARTICVKMRKIANAPNPSATLKDEAVELAGVLGCEPKDIGG